MLLPTLSRLSSCKPALGGRAVICDFVPATHLEVASWGRAWDARKAAMPVSSGWVPIWFVACTNNHMNCFPC